jgi:EAL domain-containing protein (putative c-di-GMP-specific phosphodiesterase class I)
MRESEIQAALTGAMIEARYQPIVRLADRMPVAVEVLARLRHPSRGTLLPRHFVPHIEDAGRAYELTETMANRAFTEMTQPTLASYHLDIALNFPLDVLLAPQASTLLALRHRLRGIAASQVIIELTESRPVDDLSSLTIATSRLRDAGYQVVIDDVEPEVPQLEALLGLPFTGLKLDKDLVQGMADDAAADRFVARMAEVAGARHLTITAEGVEDVATWNRLAQLGVDRAQGFMIARPMQAAAIPAWVKRWSKR